MVRSSLAHGRRHGALLVLRALILVALALLLAACRANAPRRADPSAPAAAVKLLVENDGIYSVPADALRQVGFDVAALQPEALSLTREGRPVAFQLGGQGRSRELRFYGQAPDQTAYTGQSVYRLAPVGSGAAGPAPIAARAAAPSGAAAPDVTETSVVTATVRVEEQKHYDGMAPASEDRWLWQTIFAPAEIQVPIHAPAVHAAEGEATLRVRVVANSSASVEPDHHLILSLNGARIADAKWDGIGPHMITATVPSGALHPGENTLTIAAPGDTGAPAESAMLDWVELTYPRELVVDDGELAFAGRAGEYTLAAAGELSALWDITDPAAPVALNDYVRQGGRVRFASDGTPRQFVAAAGLRQPSAIVPVTGGDLRDLPGGADLIILTVPQFREALQPLVEARQQQGLRVVVVDVDQVYDTFSEGEPGPEAIRAFMQYAGTHWATPAPRYLLLAGDASYDPRGYLRGAEIDLVPTKLVHSSFSGWTASDVWYALPDDGAAARPTLAVGRFPAQTAEQLATMVAKTLEYERGDQAAAWRHDTLVVADNDDPDFAEAAKMFTAELAGYRVRVATVDGDGSAMRQELSQAFAQGTGLLGYFGHGSVELWAQEKILAVDDVAKLTNREKLPIIFTVTCLSGLFQHPVKPSLGETLVRAKNGGGVAALVPSSAALLTDQRVLAQGLAAALGASSGPEGPKTLGDAVLAAQKSITNASGGVREVLLTFNLLGDPALPLAR